MIWTATKRFFSVALVFSMALVCASSASAGILNGHASAYGGVTGTVAFNNGIGLSGNIDYAVFKAADFNASFGGLGYVPAGPLVYTYQVEVLGNLGVSTEIVNVSNPANAIGTFNIGNVNALSASFTPNARWFFSPEIPTGQSSWGLAFSSPNLPIVGAALTVDGGSSALVAGVPTPGPGNFIPEPTSCVLFLVGMSGFGLARRIRR